ncbi:hypothetical protein DFH29DRAFT_870983 [Suillus ampliporus]|nr:hypothetical protein DFH29DRAFT_870983 [Suillus ampliporus]
MDPDTEHVENNLRETQSSVEVTGILRNHEHLCNTVNAAGWLSINGKKTGEASLDLEARSSSAACALRFNFGSKSSHGARFFLLVLNCDRSYYGVCANLELPRALHSGLLALHAPANVSASSSVSHDRELRYANKSQTLKDNRLVYPLPRRPTISTFVNTTQPNFDCTMKIQFTYLTILAIAAGVKVAFARSCIDAVCWDIPATADCGQNWEPVWSASQNCYICCTIDSE